MEEKNNFTTKYTTDGGSAWFYRRRPRCLLPHALPEFWSRPKRGTYYFSSLIGTIPCRKNTMYVFHLFYFFFSIGFVVALHIKSIAGQPLADQDVDSLFVVTLLIPLVSSYHQSSLYCFWDGGWWCWPLRGLSKSPMWSLWLPEITADADGLVPITREREIWTSIADKRYTGLSLEAFCGSYWRSHPHAFHSPMGHLADHSQPLFWSWLYTARVNNSACKQINL